jgi:uncharacterized membrane protein
MISSSHLHPMLVHFPIALIALGFIVEIASMLYQKNACLSKIGFYLLLLGTLSAIVTLFTGALFTAEMSGAAGTVKDTHELFAWITVGNLVILSAFRILLKAQNKESSNLKWIAFALYGLAALSVSITGFYGGTLVYNYMMPL